MKAAAEVLQTFDVRFKISIISAHRTPEKMSSFASQAHKRGVQVIIAGAGGAAHLPGMVASHTPIPVIGVPVIGSSLGGIDLLLSIVQMPKGVPVATVAIGNSTNAALLAIRMLAIYDPELHNRMVEYQENMREAKLRKDENLDNEGWQRYFNP